MTNEIFKPVANAEIKIVRDSVHGYMSIPSVILSKIVDTEVFQRLRRIEQTSMRSLFPSARHDRFAHSLGVYFLGEKAFRGLFDNARADDYVEDTEDITSFWRRHYWLFLLSCLLHDCGHAPFSHSFEYLYLLDEQKVTVKEKLINSIVSLHQDAEKIAQIKNDYEKYFEENPVPHESVSAIVTALYFKNGIVSALKELMGTEEYEYKDASLADDIEFIQRAIIGLKYYTDGIKDKNELYKKNLKNCFISLLNSNGFDVDKLDYIVRDSSFSGMDNMSVDIERLLKSLTIIEKYEIKEVCDIDTSVDNIFELRHVEDFSLSEYEKDSVSYPNEINLQVTNVKFKGHFSGEVISKKTIIRENELTDYREKANGSVDQAFNNADLEIIIKEEGGSIRGSFNGRVEPLYDPSYRIDGELRSKINGKIKGTIIGKINLPGEQSVQYDLGYKKSALNIIEDTLLARNRLYLWSYAHHTVTYSDYMLRQAVLFSFAKEKLEQEFDKTNYFQIIESGNETLKQYINVDSLLDKNARFYLIDDGDLTSYVKQNSCRSSDSRNEYSLQWLQRKPQKPIWKSYADYNAYFSALTRVERKVLWEMLFFGNKDKISKNIKKKCSPNEGNIRQFPESIIALFTKESGLEGMDFVWIRPGGVKLSVLDANNTFLVLGASVRRLSDALVRSKISEEYADENFFYLFLEKKLDYEKQQKLLIFLKDKARQLTQDLQMKK
jgi:HD superfamily phosphohydrolase